MNFFSSYYRALAVCLGAVLWTGCAQQASAPTTLIPAARSAGHRWIASNTSSQDLLYVTGDCGGICVFTYPGGALVQQLSDSNIPFGECVDKAGDVFVADFGGNTGTAAILEYAHGGTSPIATLSDPGYYPESCSIDPTTGNLAVTNDGGPIAIYAGAKGDPTYYTDPNAYLNGFCTYDDKGNLFVDGGYVGSGNYALVEMPKGSYRFKSIKLDYPPSFWYDIQWAGKYLAVAEGTTVIYHVAISGAKGTTIGSTVLNGPVSGIEVQFWIQSGTIIEPYGTGNLPNEIGFWRYPTGGKLRKKIDGSKLGNSELIGTVVSPATSR
jgi:DNA-binding beta-propeller fold protein YncE